MRRLLRAALTLRKKFSRIFGGTRPTYTTVVVVNYRVRVFFCPRQGKLERNTSICLAQKSVIGKMTSQEVVECSNFDGCLVPRGLSTRAFNYYSNDSSLCYLPFLPFSALKYHHGYHQFSSTQYTLTQQRNRSSRAAFEP